MAETTEEPKVEAKSGELLEDYESRPVPQEKTIGWLSQGSIWIGVGLCLAAFALGSQLAYGLSFTDMLIALFVGAGILTIIAMLMGAIGAHTRLSATMTSRYAFGKLGSVVFGLIVCIADFGWFGYQCNFFGSSADYLFETMTAIDLGSGVTMWSVIGGILMMITAVIGFKGIRKLSDFGVPLLVILVIVALIMTFMQVPLGDIVSSGPVGESISLASGITLVVGSFAVGVCIVPDFARYSKTPKDACIGSFLGYFVGYIFVVLSGAVLAYAFQINDFTQVLIAELGLGAVAAIILIIATWTTNDNNLYSSVLGAMNSIRDYFPKVKRWQLTIVGGLLATAFGALGVVTIFVPFLSLLGVLIPPIAAVIICDFFIVGRKKYYNFAVIDEVGNWRVNACVSAVAGAVVGLLMSPSLIGVSVPGFAALANVCPASIGAMVVALVLHIVLSKVHPDPNPELPAAE